MSEYVNVTNMYELANAIKERNAIEKNRLNFEKEVFEFNKQLNASSDKLDTISKAIQTLSANDSYLKKQIDELDSAFEQISR